MARRTVLVPLVAALCWAGQALPASSPSLAVLRVDRGSPADAAGLKPGDLLETVDGGPIKGPEDLAARLTARAGGTARLGYTRAGRVGTALVRLEKRYLPERPRLKPLPLGGQGGQVFQDDRPLLDRAAAGTVLSAPGPVRVFLSLSPECREEAEIAGPELRAGQVSGSGEIPGWRWYRLPRGGDFSLGGGARLRTEFDTAAHWYTDPVGYLRPLGGKTTALAERPGRPVGALAIHAGGFGTMLADWRSRWQGWGMTLWDPELGASFDEPVSWRPHAAWGFVCKGLPNSAPLPPDAGVVSAATPGARVLAIRSSSAAGRAGLAAGDLITRVNGQAIATPWDLFRIMVRSFPDQEIEVSYVRADAPKQAAFRLDGNADDEIPPDYPEQRRPSPPPVERLDGPEPRARVGGPVEVYVGLWAVNLSDVRCEAGAAGETVLPARPGKRPAVRYRLVGPARLSARPGLELRAPGGLTATWYPAEEKDVPRLVLVLEPPPPAAAGPERRSVVSGGG